MKLVITCEHGGNFVPKKYQPLFKKQETVLQTHRGFDPGTLDLFQYLKPLSHFSIFSDTSRLLIELNRSLHHKDLFSEFSKTLPEAEKKQLIDDCYLVYRNNVENRIRTYLKTNETVLHLSIHSFTPILNSVERHGDIGLLYDTKRSLEKQFCKIFKSHIVAKNPKYLVRFNYPYLGKADGFTTYLRKQFPINYLGIELEINQRFSKNNQMDSQLKADIFSALLITLQEN
jgi:predicted N-formylglutamate amidohydrolase